MLTIIKYTITFFVGAFVGRYFEGILKALVMFRRDIERVQKEAQKSIR